MLLPNEVKRQILTVELDRLKEFRELADDYIIPPWSSDACPVCREASKLTDIYDRFASKCEVCWEILSLKERCDVLDNILSNGDQNSYYFWKKKFNEYGTESYNPDDDEFEHEDMLYYFEFIDKFIDDVEEELEELK